MCLFYCLNLLYQKGFIWAKLGVPFFDRIIVTSKSPNDARVMNEHKLPFFSFKFWQF